MLRFLEWLLPDWVLNSSGDPNHCHGRRFTRAYRKKQEMVKSLWICSGLTMLIVPVMPYVASAALFTTFLSFVILDETA
jgi:hypothetical protein